MTCSSKCPIHKFRIAAERDSILRTGQFCGYRTDSGHRPLMETALWQSCTPRDGRHALCRVPDFLHRGFRLMLQEYSESESVRNQQQRHQQSWNEKCGSQLPY